MLPSGLPACPRYPGLSATVTLVGDRRTEQEQSDLLPKAEGKGVCPLPQISHARMPNDNATLFFSTPPPWPVPRQAISCMLLYAIPNSGVSAGLAVTRLTGTLRLLSSLRSSEAERKTLRRINLAHGRCCHQPFCILPASNR